MLFPCSVGATRGRATSGRLALALAVLSIGVGARAEAPEQDDDILFACSSGDLLRVRKLLEATPSEARATNSNGEGTLHVLVWLFGFGGVRWSYSCLVRKAGIIACHADTR